MCACRGGGDLELAPQGFRGNSYLENEHPRKFIQLLKTKAGLLRQKSRNDRFGFTLAEVLITLGIIGVVAALTMPTLVGNYQKKVVVERLKKVYTTMKQVEYRAIADNGDIDLWAEYWSEEILLNKYIYPYLDVLKMCKRNECEYKYTDPESEGKQDLTNKIGFYLKDGTLVKISESHIGYGGNSSVFWLGYTIDINGNNPPNIAGRDVFFAEADLSDGARCGKESLFCFFKINACRINYSKSSCYYKIYKDGWQIKDDYPW